MKKTKQNSNTINSSLSAHFEDITPLQACAVFQGLDQSRDGTHVTTIGTLGAREMSCLSKGEKSGCLQQFLATGQTLVRYGSCEHAAPCS
jgi:hypothetical protein